MSFRSDGYYYDQQLKNYILQFMAVFSGLQVQVGKFNEKEARLISVPVHYGAQDRVVASILADNTQNKPLRLPTMSAYMRGLQIAPHRMAGTGTERRKAYVPVGGLVPDDIEVIHQRRPVPYDLEMELAIYVSNTEQHFQILEQILPFFDPQLNIQLSDAPFDWSRLTHILLTSTNIDTPYPSGTDRRITQSTLNFTMPIFLETPADVRQDFVKKIFMRVGAVDSSAVTNFEIIADLDSQAIPYEVVQDASTLTIDKP